jgi:hypothetical protein
MVFNAFFKDIPITSWSLVLSVEYRKKLANLSPVTDKCYPIMLYRVLLAMNRFELTTLEVKGIDCI